MELLRSEMAYLLTGFPVVKLGKFSPSQATVLLQPMFMLSAHRNLDDTNRFGRKLADQLDDTGQNRTGRIEWRR